MVAVSCSQSVGLVCDERKIENEYVLRFGRSRSVHSSFFLFCFVFWSVCFCHFVCLSLCFSLSLCVYVRHCTSYSCSDALRLMTRSVMKIGALPCPLVAVSCSQSVGLVCDERKTENEYVLRFGQKSVCSFIFLCLSLSVINVCLSVSLCFCLSLCVYVRHCTSYSCSDALRLVTRSVMKIGALP